MTRIATRPEFQAYISHASRQFYLGRYKLACDAARANDYGAKLLKPPEEGWTMNFSTHELYEPAREKEMKGSGGDETGKFWSSFANVSSIAETSLAND